MTAAPHACIDEYALPHALGGWVASSDPVADKPTVRAFLKGVEVGWAIVGEARNAAGRRRYRIDFAAPPPPGCIADGTLLCHIQPEGGAAVAIRYWETLVLVDAAAGALATLARARAHLGSDFAGTVGNLHALFPDALDRPSVPPARPALVPSAPLADDALAHEAASLVTLPVGLASLTGDAVLGRDGFVFLLQGSNALLDQYRLPPDGPQVVETAAAWTTLIADRAARAGERGIGFRQMIVPEKSSAMPSHLPPGLAVEGPTPRLARIEREIAADPRLAGLVPSALDILRTVQRTSPAFRRVDTHLTPFGAFHLARSVLAPEEAGRVPEPSFWLTRWRHADLADRFFDVALLDPVLEADGGRPHDLALVEERVPHLDRHLGRRQVWRCPSAPVERRLLVFGNSFCNFADDGQSYLSHWLAQWFSEFHFVWDPAVDWDYVDAVRPDTILCQTIERFLNQVPAR